MGCHHSVLMQPLLSLLSSTLLSDSGTIPEGVCPGERENNDKHEYSTEYYSGSGKR